MRTFKRLKVYEKGKLVRHFVYRPKRNAWYDYVSKKYYKEPQKQEQEPVKYEEYSEVPFIENCGQSFIDTGIKPDMENKDE